MRKDISAIMDRRVEGSVVSIGGKIEVCDEGEAGDSSHE